MAVESALEACAQTICTTKGESYIPAMKILSRLFLLLGAAALGLCFAGCGNPSAMNESTANVKHITQREFATEVEGSTNPAVVDFYATWCGPCRMLAPIMDRQADAFAGKIKFYKVNVDESQALARDFQIQAIPTVLFFMDGKLTNRVTGLLPEADMKAKLEALVAAK